VRRFVLTSSKAVGIERQTLQRREGRESIGNELELFGRQGSKDEILKSSEG
jgi:hypothetical protein